MLRCFRNIGRTPHLRERTADVEETPEGTTFQYEPLLTLLRSLSFVCLFVTNPQCPACRYRNKIKKVSGRIPFESEVLARCGEIKDDPPGIPMHLPRSQRIPNGSSSLHGVPGGLPSNLAEQVLAHQGAVANHEEEHTQHLVRLCLLSSQPLSVWKPNASHPGYNRTA
ncbi:hypothetical protein CEXT_6841 [Caerostris extrusa]|uniref:Uncharacterized protein n=1 Tax=Caerostris extrusa TaxID=172846 RepID=A0AAV4XIP2_CAEEX|nr:hypothetical protein CEXT_6841 [Caerostris extrusa]